MKIKFKNNTNIVSPSSVLRKYLSPENFQNRFDSLMVTEVSQTEIHESQDHIPTNYQ